MTPAEVLAQLFPYFTLTVTVLPVFGLLWVLRSLHVKVRWLVQVEQARIAATAQPAPAEGATVTPIHPGRKRGQHG